MKPIKLEEGKFYIDQRGRQFGPMRRATQKELWFLQNPNTEHIWTAEPPSDGYPEHRWTEWGRYMDQPTPNDLVLEAKEPFATAKPKLAERFFAAIPDDLSSIVKGPFATEEQAKKALTEQLSKGYVGMVLKQVGGDYGIHVTTHTTTKLVPFADAGSVRTESSDGE